MSLVVTWSTTNGGAPMGEPLIHGTSLTQGDYSIAQTIYVRHNGINPITNCGLYLHPFASGDATQYTAANGSATAVSDYNELLSWGDDFSPIGWGGILINENAIGGFPGTSWSSELDVGDNISADGLGFRISATPALGVDSSNTVDIKTATGATILNQIQAGAAPNVRFQMKLKIPLNLSTAGTRLFDIALKFTFTS